MRAFEASSAVATKDDERHRARIFDYVKPKSRGPVMRLSQAEPR